MKLAVLSILILLLVAGLAMIQMDANTENQIQVLRETEMLTTQGLGVCQKLVNEADQPGDEPCGDKSCYHLYTIVVWNGSQPSLVDIFGWRRAVAYNQCKGNDPDKDCFTNNNRSQKCAEVWEYSDNNCFSFYAGPFDVQVPDVDEFWGCSYWGGGGTSS